MAICASVAVQMLADTASTWASAHEEILALRSDGRRVEISDRLIVNADPSRRFVFPHICQRDGEIALTALSAVSELEESYVFIPALCSWVESGRNETRSSVRIDADLVRSIARQYKRIAIYHIQPGRRPLLENYLPSYRDFVSMVLIDAEFIEEPSIGVQHRAVTEYAVIDYRFADWDAVKRRAAFYRSKGLGKHVAQNLAYEFSQKKHLRSYAAQVRLCVDRLGNVPSRIGECRRIVTELFVLDIRPVSLTARGPVPGNR